jgi:two-component system, response regulator RpfG
VWEAIKSIVQPGDWLDLLIVDDDRISLKILASVAKRLGPLIRAKCFESPVEALAWAKDHAPDFVITDYVMPEMNGIEFACRLQAMRINSQPLIVMVSGASDRQVRYQALDVGIVDFINKPIDARECDARIRNLLTITLQRRALTQRGEVLESEVLRALHSVQERERETLMRLAKAGEHRDSDTGKHLVRMAKYSRLIANNLGLPAEEAQIIELAAPLHDIGKIGIADQVLLKPGRHDPAERALMRKHPEIGFEILRDSESQYMQLGATIALGHHEKYDGTGYPTGLSGTRIPLAARIVAAADVFDALTSIRPYKPSWSTEKAIHYLERERSRHFDPEVLDAFLRSRDRIDQIRHEFEDVQSPESSHSETAVEVG